MPHQTPPYHPDPSHPGHWREWTLTQWLDADFLRRGVTLRLVSRDKGISVGSTTEATGHGRRLAF